MTLHILSLMSHYSKCMVIKVHFLLFFCASGVVFLRLTAPHFSRLLRRAWGYGRPILVLNPQCPHEETHTESRTYQGLALVSDLVRWPVVFISHLLAPVLKEGACSTRHSCTSVAFCQYFFPRAASLVHKTGDEQFQILMQTMSP